ncbi:MAG: SdiA-regulated domain-containing protein [Pseudomonadales bacterium]|nr:SdiA-regulated domain-containing protein [Pseudomonadales bacterium]
MKTRNLLAALVAAACTTSAHAQITSINLGGYTLNGSYALDTLNDMGLEASAVTYARDRGSLFFVGDEGLGVVEISRSGQTLGTMAFDWTGTGSSHNDAEGLTYLGNGELVVVDERPQIAYRFTYAKDGSVALNNTPSVAITGSTASVGNVGTEGISVDPRNGQFYTVKQETPAQLRVSTLNFLVGGGSATTSNLFSGSADLFGLNNLSDVQTLSPIDALIGHSAASNLLILSLDSRKIVEIDSTGTVLSFFDLTGLTTQAIEGVTVDELGRIYLVAEDSGTPNSRLFVLTPPAPVPVPAAVWMFGSALVGVAGFVRRRRPHAGA